MTNTTFAVVRYEIVGEDIIESVYLAGLRSREGAEKIANTQNKWESTWQAARGVEMAFGVVTE